MGEKTGSILLKLTFLQDVSFPFYKPQNLKICSMKWITPIRKVNEPRRIALVHKFQDNFLTHTTCRLLKCFRLLPDHHYPAAKDAKYAVQTGTRRTPKQYHPAKAGNDHLIASQVPEWLPATLAQTGSDP